MPGIVGIINPALSAQSSQLVNNMASVMSYEDFYKSGTYFAPEAGIGAGFVGFNESNDGIFADRSGDIVLVFSGECYVAGRIATGAALIQKYEQEGEQMIEQINGLFCGLLIDKKRKKTLLFNDRYGMRRIYFHESGGSFYFASEAKALLRILPELREFNPEGVADYLSFGCTLEWKTLFRGIDILPGGSVWIFEAGRCRKGKYFSPETWESRPKLAADDYEELLPATFKKILPRYFDSQSKTGIALTGGMDTRMIMACRPQDNALTTCYTFSGNNGQTLDDRIAARVAAAANLEHKLVRLDSDFFSNFTKYADKTVFSTDGCAGICNAHEIYFNRKARELALVRLTGNYGSEVMRGISWFKPLCLSPRLFNPGWRPIIQSRAAELGAQRTQPMTFAAFKEVPWNLYGNLSAGWSQLQFRTPYLDNELVALAFQALEAVRKSPRLPLRIVSENNGLLAQIPTDRGYANGNSGPKFLARRIFAEVTFKLDYYNNEGFPGALAPLEPLLKSAGSRLGLVGLHKFLHYRSWFQNEFAPYVRDAVTASQERLGEFFDPHFLETMSKDHIERKRNCTLEINAVLTLEAIERLLFRELPRN
jgi:asparagine synthase (glutamine-hydrolysing)